MKPIILSSEAVRAIIDGRKTLYFHFAKNSQDSKEEAVEYWNRRADRRKQTTEGEKQMNAMAEKTFEKISIQELAAKIAALAIGETCDFYLFEDGMCHGAARQQLFDGDIVLINRYGGGNPCVIDLEYLADTDQAEHVLHSLNRYFCPSEAGELYVKVEAASPQLSPTGYKCRKCGSPVYVSELTEQGYSYQCLNCDEDFFTFEVDKVAGTDKEVVEPLDKSKLYNRETLLRILEENGANEPAIAAISDQYMESLGQDPVWQYPLCDTKYLGGFVVPVQEGWLWIPYDSVDKEEYELLVLDDTNLLDAETCEYLANELKEYCAGFVAALGRIQNELKTQEKNEND